MHGTFFAAKASCLGLTGNHGHTHLVLEVDALVVERAQLTCRLRGRHLKLGCSEEQAVA